MGRDHHECHYCDINKQELQGPVSGGHYMTTPTPGVLWLVVITGHGPILIAGYMWVDELWESHETMSHLKVFI